MQIDQQLLDHYTYLQVASILNDRGLRSGDGKPFISRIVARIWKRHGLLSRYDRLRKAGMLTVYEMAAILGITSQWVKVWNRHGLLRSHAYTITTTACMSIQATIRHAKRKV